MTDDITDPDYDPNSIDPDMYERLKNFSSHLGSVSKINFITPKADHIPTGVKSLAEMLNGGIRPHEIAILAVGNTSMGKSKALVFLIILDKLQYGGITPEQATSPDKNINKGI